MEKMDSVYIKDRASMTIKSFIKANPCTRHKKKIVWFIKVSFILLKLEGNCNLRKKKEE